MKKDFLPNELVEIEFENTCMNIVVSGENPGVPRHMNEASTIYEVKVGHNKLVVPGRHLATFQNKVEQDTLMLETVNTIVEKEREKLEKDLANSRGLKEEHKEKKRTDFFYDRNVPKVFHQLTRKDPLPFRNLKINGSRGIEETLETRRIKENAAALKVELEASQRRDAELAKMIAEAIANANNASNNKKDK